MNLAAIKIDIAPAKRGDLTAAHARSQADHRHRVERPATEHIEKRLDLIGGKDLDLGALDARRPGGRHRVGGDNAPFDGMAENAMEQSVDMSDRAGRQPAPSGFGRCSFPYNSAKLTVRSFWIRPVPRCGRT
jgi:hypothetical protein